MYIGRMLLDSTERFVVSSIGWVDGGGFVHRDLESGNLRFCPVEEDGFVKLKDIDGDRFLCIAHWWEKRRVRFDVRRYSEPAASLWSLAVTPERQELGGDPAAATGAPRFDVGTFQGDTATGRLIEIAPGFERASLHDLPWYGDGYDLGYQGLTDAIALPNSERVLVSVQRSSVVVVHDLKTGGQQGSFGLADRGGNPFLKIVGEELWTIDYDTFVRVSLKHFRAVATSFLQPGDNGTRQFAGEMHIIPSRNKIAVARPFSADVVIVDPIACRIEQSIAIGRQPLVCVVTNRGKVIAREWKTADWLEASMEFVKPKPIWRFW